MWRERAVAWPLRAAVAVLVALPVAVFFYEAVRGLGASAESGSGALFTWALLGKSLGLAAMVAAIATIVGVPAGLVAGRLPRRWAAVTLFVFVLPIAVPPSVHAYLWRNLAMSAGLLGVLFVEGGSDVVNVAGATLSLVGALWTIPALAAFAVAAGPGRRFELEARPFVSAAVAARKVLVPAALPVAAAAAGVVFILAFADYGGPAMWQITTYPVQIQALYSSFFEPERAAAAALIPAAVTGLLATLVYVAGRRAFSRFDVEQVNTEPDALWRPGRGLKAALLCVVAGLTGVPIALSGYWMVAARPQIVDVSASLSDLLATLAIATVAAALSCALAIAATGAHWPRFARWRTALAVAALAAFVIPPAALGLAVKEISQWRMVPVAFGDTSAAYGFALAGRFFAVPAVLTMLAVERLDSRYAHLVRTSGVGPLRRIAATALPVMLPAGMAAWAVAVVLGVGELPIGILLAAPGSPQASVDLFNLMHYARRGEAFAVTLAMMFGAAALVVAVLAVTRRLWKRYLPTV